jgi:hypothetical protein
MAKPAPLRKWTRDTSLKSAAQAVMRARLTDVRRFEADIVKELDFAAIHDMRRLRAALKMFDLDDVHREAKRLQGALGALRDLQLQERWLSEELARVSEVDRSGITRVRDQACASADQAGPALRKEIRRWRRRTLPAILRDTEAVVAGRQRDGSRTTTKISKRLGLKPSERPSCATRTPSRLWRTTSG